MKKTDKKYPFRSDEDYFEISLEYCGRLMKQFRRSHFRINSKYKARIFVKLHFPRDCPEKLWMRYLVFEVNGFAYQISPITHEAFDTLIREIEPNAYGDSEFYTIEKHDKPTLIK